MKKAFTLIELLLVISIIALISSIVLSNVRESKLKAESANILKSLQQIRNVAEIYYSSNGYYAQSRINPTGTNLICNSAVLNGSTKNIFQHSDIKAILDNIVKYTPNKSYTDTNCAVSNNSWVISIRTHKNTIKSTAYSILEKFGITVNAQTSTGSFIVTSNAGVIKVFNNMNAGIVPSSFISGLNNEFYINPNINEQTQGSGNY